MAGILQGHVRGSDLVARTGGEEFLLVLPEAGREATVHRAEQLRAAVADLRGPGTPLPDPVTLSLGVAVYPDDGRTGPDALAASDAALYAAKDQGRNRVVSAGGPGWAPAQSARVTL